MTSAIWPDRWWSAALIVTVFAANLAFAANGPTSAEETTAAANRTSVDEEMTRKTDTSVLPPLAQTIRVRFESRTQDGLAVELKPDYPSIEVRPGQRVRMYFFLNNLSNETVTVRPTYDVLPHREAVYYNQVQNICAADPTLKAGDTVRLWQDFYLDPAIATLPEANLSRGLTVSYTISKVEQTAPARFGRRSGENG